MTLMMLKRTQIENIRTEKVSQACVKDRKWIDGCQIQSCDIGGQKVSISQAGECSKYFQEQIDETIAFYINYQKRDI